jgi:hypothetical protein
MREPGEQMSAQVNRSPLVYMRACMYGCPGGRASRGDRISEGARRPPPGFLGPPVFWECRDRMVRDDADTGVGRNGVSL